MLYLQKFSELLTGTVIFDGDDDFKLDNVDDDDLADDNSILFGLLQTSMVVSKFRQRLPITFGCDCLDDLGV